MTRGAPLPSGAADRLLRAPASSGRSQPLQPFQRLPSPSGSARNSVRDSLARATKSTRLFTLTLTPTGRAMVPIRAYQTHPWRRYTPRPVATVAPPVAPDSYDARHFRDCFRASDRPAGLGCKGSMGCPRPERSRCGGLAMPATFISPNSAPHRPANSWPDCVRRAVANTPKLPIPSRDPWQRCRGSFSTRARFLLSSSPAISSGC